MSKGIISTKLPEFLAVVAKRAAETNANSRCMFIYHQPKFPDTLNKLRKFK